MSSPVTVTTNPSLGQISQVSASNSLSVRFQAVLEVPKNHPIGSWELALWHHSESTANSGEWTETALSRADEGLPDLHGACDDDRTRLFFTATLDVQSSLKFTAKFRQSPQDPWRWARDELGVDDGIVIVNQHSSQKSDSDGDLADLIQDLNPDLEWQTRRSQSPGTRLWQAEVPVDGATDESSAFATVPIGIPRFLRWFALVRDSKPWIAPRQGKDVFQVEKDILLCSFLSPEGKHLVLLGISGICDVLTLFRHGDSNKLIAHVRNDDAQPQTGTVLVAVGDNFESAGAAVIYHARTLLAKGAQVSTKREEEMKTLVDDIKPEWYENWYDGLGYCTWNALGQQLTAEKVLKAVDTLAENNISISSLIIDDNWQDIDYKGDNQFQYAWNDFEAQPEAFPKGLKALVSDIRSKHKSIQYIAVWHALLGYWGGIAPDGKLANKYKTVEVLREESERKDIPLGGKITVVAKEDADRFYDDFYKFLSSCGIDGVKTDAQFMLDTVVSPKARRGLLHTYMDAWTLASLRHFGNRVISCMSLTPQNIFYSLMPRNRPALLCRNSDDFFPDNERSHPWHIWANAHNNLFTQHLNILPDWDMFQTRGPYAGFHAAARCVSGGPVYITDVPGEHEVGLIKQMTATTTRGRTVILRPSVLGRTIDQYNGYDDPSSLLKIGAYHGRAVTGTPIMGIFNVSAHRRLTELIPVARFSGILPSMQYIVRSHTTGKITPPMWGTAACISSKHSLRDDDAVVAVTLDVGCYDILCAFPLSLFQTEMKGRVLAASLGLLDKMTGCAAMLNTKITMLDNGRLFVDTRLKALGVLGVYISALDHQSVMEDLMVTIQGQPIPPHTVSINTTDKHVLDIDIESAWDEMGLESGWSNEVEVKVYYALDK